MVQFVGYHATSSRHRESIQQHGLDAEFSRCLVSGVYVFDPYMDNYPPAPTAQRCGWDYGPGQDLWRVVYCGPMLKDSALTNAVILPSVTDVTLVTGNE